MPYGNYGPTAYKAPSLEEIESAISLNVPKPNISVSPVNLRSQRPTPARMTSMDIPEPQFTPEQPSAFGGSVASMPEPSPIQIPEAPKRTPEEAVSMDRKRELAQTIRTQYSIGPEYSDQQIVDDYLTKFPQAADYLENKTSDQKIVEYARTQHGIGNEYTDEQILEDYYSQNPQAQYQGAAKGVLGQQPVKKEWNDNLIPRLDPFFEHDPENGPNPLKMIGNVIPSAYNVVADIGNMALNPYDTGKGLVKMISGAGVNLGKGALKLFLDDDEVDQRYAVGLDRAKREGGAFGKLASILESNEEMADMVGDHLVERYGSADGIAKTMTEDPLGMIADIAGVVEGGASLIRTGAKAGGLTRVAGVADDVARTANRLDPYVQATEAGMRGLQKTAGAVGDAGRYVKSKIPVINREGGILENTKLTVASQVTGLPEDVLKIAIEEPDVVAAAQRGDITPLTLEEDITRVVDELDAQGGEAGQKYQALYGVDKNFDGTQIYNQAIDELENLGITLENGKVQVSSTKYTLKNGEKAQLQRMVDILEEIKDNKVLNTEELHNVRRNVDGASKWVEGVNKNKSFAGGKLRDAIDSQLKTIPERKKLDAQYARMRKSALKLKEIFFTRNGKFKKAAFSQLKGTMLNPKYARELKVAEQFLPGITRQIKGIKFAEALNATKNLKPGQYTRSIILGLMGAGAAGPMGWLLGAFSLNPEAAVKILQRLSKKEQKILDAVAQGKQLNDEAQKIYAQIEAKLKAQVKALPEPKPEQITPEGVIRNQNPIRVPGQTKKAVDVRETGQQNVSQPTNPVAEALKKEKADKAAAKAQREAEIQKAFDEAEGNETRDVSKFKVGQITDQGKIIEVGFNGRKPFFRVEGDNPRDYRYQGVGKDVNASNFEDIMKETQGSEQKPVVKTADEMYDEYLNSLKDEFEDYFAKEMIQEIGKIEATEQRIGKVGRNKVGKEYSAVQNQEWVQRRERAIERIAEEYGLDANEAADRYDYFVDRADEYKAKYKMRQDAIDEGYNISNEKAEEVIRRYFTKEELPVRFVEKITTPEGMQAYGKYHRQAIELVNNPKKGVPEHEVVHAYFDMFTTKQRQRKVLDQVKKQQNITDDLQAEEWLADAFNDYLQKKPRTFTGVVKQLFDEVWQAIKSVFGKEDKVKALFQDIEDRVRMTKLNTIKEPRFSANKAEKAFGGKFKNYLFHTTSRKNLSSIKRNGLRRSEKGYHGPAVYMGDEPMTTLGYYESGTSDDVTLVLNKKKMIEDFGMYSEKQLDNTLEWDQATGEVYIDKKVIPQEYIVGWMDTDYFVDYKQDGPKYRREPDDSDILEAMNEIRNEDGARYKKYYHGTNERGKRGIEKEGFKIGEITNGRSLGNVVYITDSKKIAELFGKEIVELELQKGIKLREPKKIEGNIRTPNEYEKMRLEYVEKYGMEAENKLAEDLSKKYDGVTLGTQTLIFDPKKIVVNKKRSPVPNMKSLFDGEKSPNKLALGEKKDTIKVSSNNQSTMQYNQNDVNSVGLDQFTKKGEKLQAYELSAGDAQDIIEIAGGKIDTKKVESLRSTEDYPLPVVGPYGLEGHHRILSQIKNGKDKIVIVSHPTAMDLYGFDADELNPVNGKLEVQKAKIEKPEPQKEKVIEPEENMIGSRFVKTQDYKYLYSYGNGKKVYGYYDKKGDLLAEYTVKNGKVIDENRDVSAPER